MDNINIYVVYTSDGGPVQAFENKKDAEEFAKDDWKISCVALNKHIIPKTLNELWYELRFTNEWKAACQCTIKQNECIKYINEQTNRKRHLFPDGLIIEHKIIIEYYGSLWHADPKHYKETDIVYHNKTANDIWCSDNNRIKLLNNLGYNVIIVWQSDFQHREEKCINNIMLKIKEICKL